MDNGQNEERATEPDEAPDDVEAAREQIEETRAAMSETIDAIEDKLAIDRINRRVQDAIHEATVGKAQQMAERVAMRAKGTIAGLPSPLQRHARAVTVLGSGVAGSIALLAARAWKQRSQKSTMPDQTSKASSSDSKQPAASAAGKGGSMTKKTINTTLERSRDMTQGLTKQARAAANRASGRGTRPEGIQAITANLQHLAQENLLTMATVVLGTALASAARVFDRRRTQGRTAKKGMKAPLLIGATVLPGSVVGVGIWRLTRRKEGAMTGQQLLLAWLNDAYAMETALVRTLRRHVKDAQGHPEIQTRLQQHLEQTRQHAGLVRSCIKRCGGRTSSLKTVWGGVAGTIQGLSAAPAPDQLVKSALTDAAAEHFEVASYTALVAAAQELGDQETASICQQILGEDEVMARWIEEGLPKITRETVHAVTSLAE